MSIENLKFKYKTEERIRLEENTTDSGTPVVGIVDLNFEKDKTRLTENLSQNIFKIISSVINTYDCRRAFKFSDTRLGIFNFIEGLNNISENEFKQLSEKLISDGLGDEINLIACDFSSIENTNIQYNSKIFDYLKKNDFVIFSASEDSLERDVFTILDKIEKSSLHIWAQFNFRNEDDTNHLTKSLIDLLENNQLYDLDSYKKSLSLILASKKKPTETFIFEGSVNQFEDDVLFKFTNKISGINLNEGKIISIGNYQGPLRRIAEETYKRLIALYSNWETEYLGDLLISSKNIIFGDDEIDNNKFLYFRATSFVPSQNLYSPYPQTEHLIKGKKYLQIELNQSKILNNYAKIYFSMPIARSIIQKISTKHSFNFDKFKEIVILAPPLEQQEKMIRLDLNRKNIASNLTNLKLEFLMDPSSYHDSEEKINAMLSIFNQLDDRARLSMLITKGESKVLEFKETFSVDVKKNEKQKYIEDSAIKTIAGFMNSIGGTLLIGIDDFGNVVGVNSEIDKFYKSTDKYLLHLKNIIKQRLGEDNYPFIEYKLIFIDSRLVLEVNCKKSTSPVFVDDIDFYVRTNPATDKLDGKKQLAYIKNHFGLL
jgi:hypothetical protein